LGIKNARQKADKKFKKSGSAKFVRSDDKCFHSRQRLSERMSFVDLTITIKNIRKWLQQGKAKSIREKKSGRILVYVPAEDPKLKIILDKRETEIITVYPLQN